MYPQIVFHCIDDDMMNIDGETMFRSSVGGIRYWILCFGVLLSLDMLYPQIISHCIDDDMMTFDYETMFRSSIGCRILLVVRLVSFEKLTQNIGPKLTTDFGAPGCDGGSSGTTQERGRFSEPHDDPQRLICS